MKLKHASAFLLASVAMLASAAESPSDTFTADGKLRRPADVREYVYLSSGIGMAYGPARERAAGEPPFTNVYVKPEAYRAFMKSGVWPDGSVFLLEIRRGVANASVDSSGRTQGAPLALEASVKDTTRYPDGGWAYFDFGSTQKPLDSAAPQPRSASCYSCHSKHGAVEWSFTQFYPEQFAVAQQKGTVRKDYDPNRKAE
ncbi:MAG TPA: cytochrome P460 family protein [Steroidobacteraceae bacterium]|nr:cytochrome P460 family protein [Steroidobacteraceae bacterium]